MKLENYEYIKGWCTPSYWYEEGKKREEYWVDSQNMFYYKFCEYLEDEDGNEKEDKRKYYIISAYKPVGVVLTEENFDDNVKWLVEDSYHTCKWYIEEGHAEEDYEYYEWDFENHCIKT